MTNEKTEMQINIDLTNLYAEEYQSISDVIRGIIKDKLSDEVTNLMAQADYKKELTSLAKDGIVSDYKQALDNLRREQNGQREKIEQDIIKCFDNLLLETSIVANQWGQNPRTITIKELILEKVGAALKDVDRRIEQFIKIAVETKLKQTEYDIKKMIDETSREIIRQNVISVVSKIVDAK